MMKLSDYAKTHGIKYLTAYLYWKKGFIKGHQMPTGTIFINDEEFIEHKTQKTEQKIEQKSELNAGKRAILYARVSSAENKDNLERQITRLRDYASAKGYSIVKEVSEIGSGINDKRRKLLNVIKDKKSDIIVVEHKDRFSRFGTAIIEELLGQTGKRLEIINQAETEKADIIQDLISIITSYSAKIYGKRRTERKTETIIKKLKTKTTEL